LQAEVKRLGCLALTFKGDDSHALLDGKDFANVAAASILALEDCEDRFLVLKPAN